MDHECPREGHRSRQDDGGGTRRGWRGAQNARTAFLLLHDAAGIPRRGGRSRHRETDQPARFCHRRQASAQSCLPNVFAVGVCVAIAPVGATPVPVGVPKTGFMIESMVTATAMNIGALLRGRTANAQPTWNAICLADFGDTGVAFLAQPQIPPRNVNWSSKGEWVHYAKVAFEKYFLRKMRRGESEPFYERFVLNQLNIPKIKEVRTGT